MSRERLIRRAKMCFERLERIGIRLEPWEKKLIVRAAEILGLVERLPSIPGHDVEHVFRVLEVSIILQRKHGGDLRKLVLACLLHDVGRGSEDHAMASARLAKELLRGTEFSGIIDDVSRIIEEHSYGSGRRPTSIESMILQDADRIDALGAIGIARVFAYGGHMGRSLYDLEKPRNYGCLGHFFSKIMRLPEAMNTEMGRKIAEERLRVVRLFVERMLREISLDDIASLI